MQGELELPFMYSTYILVYLYDTDLFLPHPHEMVKHALTDPHTQSVTAVIYGAHSKLNSKPTELHGNASIDFTELCTCDCRQLHHTGKHQTGAQEELAAGVPGLDLREWRLCSAMPHWQAVRLCLLCAAACLQIQESLCNLTVAIFSVNFRTDQ